MSTDDTKAQLLAQFHAYLEATDLQSELVPTDGPDLFSLLAELAALKNEVKIESKQVMEAMTEFRKVFESLRRANDRLSSELTRQQQQGRDSASATERELLLELLDLRDRLQRGHAHAYGYQPNWLAHLAKADEVVTSIAKGLEMNLRRLDEALERRDIRSFKSLGVPFDANTMTAVEVVADRHYPQGEVVGEVRPGFLRGEKVLRTAEVIVNHYQESPID